LARETLGEFLSKMPESIFCRVHRTAAVNLLKIKSLEHLFHQDYSLTLTNNDRLTMSRSYSKQVLKQLGR
jgi:two-component system LytT family response regulator